VGWGGLVQLMNNEHRGQHVNQFINGQNAITITVKNFETDYNISQQLSTITTLISAALSF